MARSVSLLGVLLLALAGCRKPVLNEDRQFDLSQGTPSFTFTVEPIKQAQTIKVQVSADEPVTVVVGLKKDEEALINDIMRSKFSDKALAKEAKTKEASLQAAIPANEAAAVIVSREANKATKVRLKVAN